MAWGWPLGIWASPPWHHPHPHPSPHTPCRKVPCPGWAPRQPGTVPGSPPSAGSRVGRAAEAPRTWPGALGASRTRGRRPGPEGEGTPGVRRVGTGRVPGRSRLGVGGGGHKAGQCQAPPASLLQRPGSAGRPSMQEARAGGRLRAEPGLQGGPARRGRGCQGEKHPKACKLLLSAFFFFSPPAWEGKKIVLPLEADAKRMQNFNHLLYQVLSQQGLGPGLARSIRGQVREWPQRQMPLPGRCQKARLPGPPSPELGPPRGCED